MLSPEITQFLQEFRHGTHAVLFYDTLENKREVLFRHLKYGIEREGLTYVCSEENPRQIREDMKKSGIDVEGLTSRNQLTISNYDSLYIVNGRVNIPKIEREFRDMAEKYISSGLRGLRAAAEMSCFFQEGKVNELIAYEYAIHRRLSFPAEGICAYNILDMSKSGTLETIMPLLRAHDPVILTGPGGTVLLPPEQVGEKEVENAMQIKIKHR